MESGFIAAVGALLALAFVESLGLLYPSRETWMRLRRARGRTPMVRMRERFEASAARRTPRVLAMLLVALMGAWVAAASLLDKRWHEVLLDVVPYVIVGTALVRIPPALRAIAERMRRYEREFGDDKEHDVWPLGPDGEIAL